MTATVAPTSGPIDDPVLCAAISAVAADLHPDVIVTDRADWDGNPAAVLVCHPDPVSCRVALGAIVDRRVQAALTRDELECLAVFTQVAACGHVIVSTSVGAGIGALLRLDDRHLATLRLIAAGATNAAIAEHLGVSEMTVKRTVRFLHTHFSTRTRAELTAAAFAVGCR